MGRQRVNQTDLADALGMPINSLRRRLSGETTITVDDLYAVARALDVPVQRLLPDRAPAVRVPAR
jgi:transcriptional regulator with XRE-family HTH domain